ncbi:MAG: glycosyltransferase family 4 protein [Acidobacteria bacterium]|nr:glycosyltransferase family 4 protein [Acidobacteriota bacterium]
MKPRILIISPVTPYPVHHGAGSTIYGYIRALREAFDIFFIGFCPERFQQQAQEGLDHLCRKAWVFSPPPARRLDAFSSTPFLFSNLESEPMHRAVDRILEQERPDLVQVEYLGMAEYADRAQCPRIIRAHVLEWWHYYLNWQRMQGWRTRLESLFWSLDSIRHNRRTLESFDWVLVTSEEERCRALELVPQARAEALPFFLLDCEYFRPAALPPRQPQILFVGFLPHTPNGEALSYFIREELPLIRKQVPAARLVVVGEGASNALLGLMHDQDVDYLGYVEDLRPLYHRSRVYVAPINSGGGIRTKIVEAMAAGVPVVCNSFAPLGLGLQSDHHVVVRDGAEESAMAVVQLLRDEQRCHHFRDAARQLVENCFSLHRVGPLVRARYLQFLEQAA